jgi:RimJ/RimL family protein N-acetyltransferase
MKSLMLRDLRQSDLSTRIDWINHPLVAPHLSIETPIEREKTERWFEGLVSRDNRRDFAVVEGEAIRAFCGLTNRDPWLQKAELYLFVDPALQRRGIGSRSVQLLLDFGFNRWKPSLKKIFLYCNGQNHPARMVYEKNGFRLEGMLRQEVLRNGAWDDRCYYGIFDDEFNAGA